MQALRFSSLQTEHRADAARMQFVRASMVLIVVFILIEAPRGQHYFDKMKYNGSLWAYMTSLVFVAAGVLSIVNGYLLRYSQRIRISVDRPASWMTWVISGAAFAWLGCDKMLAIHEKIAFALIKVSPALASVGPSKIDGVILAAYGLCAVPIGIALMRGLLMSPVARKYFTWGFCLMLLAVCHDATESSFDFSLLLIDGETFEKLFEMFSGWAFACAFLTTSLVLGTRILHAWYGPEVAGKLEHAETSDVSAEIA